MLKFKKEVHQHQEKDKKGSDILFVIIVGLLITLYFAFCFYEAFFK